RRPGGVRDRGRLLARRAGDLRPALGAPDEGRAALAHRAGAAAGDARHAATRVRRLRRDRARDRDAAGEDAPAAGRGAAGHRPSRLPRGVARRGAASLLLVTFRLPKGPGVVQTAPETTRWSGQKGPWGM